VRLLKASGCGALLPILLFAGAEHPSFEAAALKLSQSNQPGMMLRVFPGGRLRGVHLTLQQMITVAWDLQKHQVTSRIDWLSNEYFDLEATAGHPAGEPELRLMMQTMIEERFHLKSHLESHQMTIYSLVESKKGVAKAPNIHSAPDGDCGKIVNPDPNAPPAACGGETANMGHIVGHRTNFDELATNLAMMVDREVVNKTGLTGSYDLTLNWSPDATTESSIFTALDEQLGLRLEAGRGPVNVLVVDSADKLESN
jgi:uncharacterized protein (TIGR03435 family)